jgi:hypothetical protein
MSQRPEVFTTALRRPIALSAARAAESVEPTTFGTPTELSAPVVVVVDGADVVVEGTVVEGTVVVEAVVEGTVVVGAVVEGTVVEGTVVEGTVVERTVVVDALVEGGAVERRVVERTVVAARVVVEALVKGGVVEGAVVTPVVAPVAPVDSNVDRSGSELVSVFPSTDGSINVEVVASVTVTCERPSGRSWKITPATTNVARTSPAAKKELRPSSTRWVVILIFSRWSGYLRMMSLRS